MRNGHAILTLSLLASVAAAACSATSSPRQTGATGAAGMGGAGGAPAAGGASSHASGPTTSSGATSTSSTSSASSSGTASSGSSTSGSTSSASSTGATSSSATGSSSSSSTSGGPLPVDFDGGWQVPNPGMNPALVGDGGTTVVLGPGADPSSPGKFGGASNGQAPTIVYPPNGVMVPPNTNSMEFHFIPAPGQTLFRFTFKAPTTTLEVFTGCTPVGGGCVYTVDPTFWSSLAAYARGTQPVTYTLSGVNGGSPGSVGTSAQATIAFDQQDMTGGIYYWNTGGVIQRYDYGFPNAPVQQYFTPANAGALLCVGCHVLSREGNKVAVGKDIPSPAPFQLFDVASKAALKVNGQPVGGTANFFSFSPDGQFLVASDGVSVTWMDVVTNQVLPGPVVPSGTMPDWAPDGLHMVYAQPSSSAFFPVPGVSSASIVKLHFNGTSWDTPVTLVPFAGQNNYYPTFSPTGDWVVFNRSPQNAESFANASPDPDAGTKPDGELWTVAAAGGNAVRLSHASDPGACSWPKWAPVLHDYYGGKVMWLTFSSARAYGLRLADGQQTQLWMAAFDPAKAAMGQDPSFPAFWLPFQDIGGGNHIAQWSTKVPRKACTSTSQCDPGETCKTGTCTPG